MQFNNNDSGSRLQSEINITPLVDVVLVLLIIFMVVVPLLLEGYDVDIPRASADTSAQAAESRRTSRFMASWGEGWISYPREFCFAASPPTNNSTSSSIVHRRSRPRR